MDLQIIYTNDNNDFSCSDDGYTYETSIDALIQQPTNRIYVRDEDINLDII